MQTDDRFPQSSPQPQPGEIWVVNCDRPIRYAQIVKESLDLDLGNSSPVEIAQTVANDPIVSIMVLSLETQYLSDVDLLIPRHVSGLAADILAETWNVEYVAISSLSHPTGRRLSRDIYNLLLSVGDFYYNPAIAKIPIEYIHDLGLEMGTRLPISADFHCRERVWMKSVTIDLGTLDLMAETMAVEREFIDLYRSRICLSRWHDFDLGNEWSDAQEFRNLPTIAMRNSAVDLAELERTIAGLKSSQDKAECRKLITRLGLVGKGDRRAIATLTKLLSTTQDDETLWTIVDVLQAIDPQSPHFAMGKVKQIDVGECINLVVRWIQKNNGKMGVFVQVYPDKSLNYLPANLKFSLLDNLGIEIKKLTANSVDRWIQLKFNGKPGELFSIALKLGSVESIEDFVL